MRSHILLTLVACAAAHAQAPSGYYASVDASSPALLRSTLHAVIDDNTMACEDLKVADLDGDGRPEVIAAGRASRNVVIYWNETPKS